MRSLQDIAGALQTRLEQQVNVSLASVRTAYQMGYDDADGGLTDIASVVDTVETLPEPDQMPTIQVECLGKRTESSQATVEPEFGAAVTLDRRAPCRLWVFLRGQSYGDVSHRQRATATAIEEVLYGDVRLTDDGTLRIDPTTITFDLSDIGLDPASSRSFGGIRFNLDVVFTEQVAAPTPLGTADTAQLDVVSLGLA